MVNETLDWWSKVSYPAIGIFQEGPTKGNLERGISLYDLFGEVMENELGPFLRYTPEARVVKENRRPVINYLLGRAYLTGRFVTYDETSIPTDKTIENLRESLEPTSNRRLSEILGIAMGLTMSGKDSEVLALLEEITNETP